MRRGVVRAGLLAVLIASGARAEGRLMFAEPFQGKKLVLDGLLKEWPGGMTALDDVLEGALSEGEPRASAQLGYDDRHLHVALKIVDDRIVAGKDRAILLLAFPKPGGGHVLHEVALVPGDPGKTAGSVQRGGAAVPGAKLVEAPDKQGLTVEASLPWSTFPESGRVRVGLRAAVRYVDVDGGGAPKAVVATSRAGKPAELPWMPLEGEQGLFDGVLRAHGLSDAPAEEVYGNVSGDAFLERVARFGDYVTITGPRFRGGKEYFFSEHGRGLSQLQLHDFDGDGREEIVFVGRLGGGERYAEVLHVMRVGEGDVPAVVFQQEVKIVTPEGTVENRFSFPKAGRGATLQLERAGGSGFDPAAYRKLTPEHVRPALLPWDSVSTRTFAWTGGGLERAEEKTSAAKYASGGPKKPPRAAPPEGPPPPPPPRPPTADELLDQVYALYRKDRGVGPGKPRFDFVTDVAGDATPERVLVHQKDVVVFGKGFLGGLKYAYLTLQVTDPKDVLDVTARDLTGDGKAEVLVRLVLHAKASKELGGGTVDRHAFLAYQVGEGGIRRIFAAETARAVGEQRILGAVAFLPTPKGVRLEVRAGRAVGWTEKTYPFPPDTTPAGGLEPLLLPWLDPKRRAYRFDGTSYVSE